MSTLKRLGAFLCVFLSAHAIAALSKLISGLFDFSFIESVALCDIAYVFIFYVLQVALSLAAIRLYVTKSWADAGFNLKEHRYSLRIFARFIAIWTGIVAVFYTLALLFIPSFADYLSEFCPPDVLYGVKNLVGGSVFAGLGEEPLFRSFVVLALSKNWQGGIKIGKRSISFVSLLSGFIFMTAHIGYTFLPHFAFVHIDFLQLTYTFILGVFWSAVFEKTRSLLCPVLAHMGANFIQYFLGYIVTYLII